MLDLSVLDLAVIGQDSSPEQALRDVVQVARTAERHGYHRFWVAEHHAAAATAGSSPAVLLAYIAACTKTLRVGSGGVMLPNHAPLVVAEQFAVLQGLHDGRVDLGVGRSSGGNTTSNVLHDALYRHPRAMAEFSDLVDELLGFLHDSWPAGHRFESLRMSPRISTPPGVFVLGAGENSARLAAERGLPFVYGHHLGRSKARPAAVDRYRATFTGERPYVIASVNVVCAETDEEAERAAIAVAQWDVRRREGDDLIESRLRYLVDQVLDEGQVVRGAPTTVLNEIHNLATTMDVDEIMLVPIEHTGTARSRTLRLIAESRHADRYLEAEAAAPMA
ncbi:MsnO8 family LLM class oxidoreductase [Kibdelosporangium persicum]|uniref:LLM class flavin-dependent oxidoreductase n=1 Tax=Kibdelosporangium persicum TaxID=2698649 RepID=A0ABX2F965_9PSEU|nr:MsnO8 family LLM class oxidoreductase [Kibdelosporangium persicum]NRN67901.1 LLM class flavin-dependent oxidoreductase [Kibdelosporangium persicum]